MEKKIDLTHLIGEDFNVDSCLSNIDKLISQESLSSRLIDYCFNVDVDSFELCIKYKEEYT